MFQKTEVRFGAGTGARDLTVNAECGETDQAEDTKPPQDNFTPKIGLKPLQLLTEPQPAVPRSEKEDVKLKIDDLIIIPNNINHGEEGGSALQNLAKIASRYSSLNKDKSRGQEFPSPGSKKPRLEEKPSVAQPLPPTSQAKKPGLPGLPSLPGSQVHCTPVPWFSLMLPRVLITIAHLCE